MYITCTTNIFVLCGCERRATNASCLFRLDLLIPRSFPRNVPPFVIKPCLIEGVEAQRLRSRNVIRFRDALVCLSECVT